MHRTIETLVQKAPTISVPASSETDHPVKPKVPYADLFSKPSGVTEDGWRITDVYVADIKIKVGSYWDEPVARNKMRISAVGGEVFGELGSTVADNEIAIGSVA